MTILNTGGKPGKTPSYGGDPTIEQQYRQRNWDGTESAAGNEAEALRMLDVERRDAQQRNAGVSINQMQERQVEGANSQALAADAGAERAAAHANNAQTIQDSQTERGYANASYKDLGSQNTTLRNQQFMQGGAYGAGADRSIGDYNTGRGAILAGASELEGYARNAGAEYQSGADKAFAASQQRNQQQALGLAAGRGANSIRTALATSQSANAQGALDQQVVKAQEANQLNAMRNQAVTSAAGIRSGVGGMDQSAAGMQAQRQQQANAQVAGYQNQNAGIVQANTQAGQANIANQAAVSNQDAQVGLATGQLRSNIAQNSANYGLQSSVLQGQLAGQDASLGAANQTARVQSAQQMRGDYLGTETSMEGAKLGADMTNEAQKQQWRKENTAAAQFGRAVKGTVDPGGLL
jgi:hypothetical protein